MNDGGEHFADESNNGANAGSRRGLYIAIFAACVCFAVVVVMGVKMMAPEKDTSIYSVDSSRYGVPDDCADYTAFCVEREDGNVQCSCGDYLYLYDLDNAVWELANGGGN